MGLETGTFLTDLVVTNPTSGDKKSAGDDHLRLIKSVLKNTFPNSSKAFYFPDMVTSAADTTVLASDMSKTFFVNTFTSSPSYTLPVLGAGDAGWQCHFAKQTLNAAPFFILPPAGVAMYSGEVGSLAKARRAVPNKTSTALWTGSYWLLSRVVDMPVGSVIEFAGQTLPFGFEWPNGQLLSLLNYPDYNFVRGSTSTPDRRGRFAVGKDDLGGTAANRVTAGSSGIAGATFEATGGVQSVTLDITQIPAHNHGGATGAAGAHTHDYEKAAVNSNSSSPGGSVGGTYTGASTTASLDHTHTIPSQGGGLSHNNMPPTIVENFILVVE